MKGKKRPQSEPVEQPVLTESPGSEIDDEAEFRKRREEWRNSSFRNSSFRERVPAFRYIPGNSESYNWEKVRKWVTACSSDSERAEFLNLYAKQVREDIATLPLPASLQARLNMLAEHAEKWARELEGTPIDEPTTLPKIRVECSQTQFVLLIGRLYKLEKFHSDLEPKTITATGKVRDRSNEIPWSLVCQHFEKRDGTPFKPKDLASEWSRIVNDGKRPRGAKEIEDVLAEIENVESQPTTNLTPERISGALRESNVAKSAPGRVGAARR